MATARLSFVFTEVKGKIGNTVCSRSPHGTVIRQRVAGKDPRTPAQIARRSAVEKTATAWKTLDAQEVAAWFDYAKSKVSKDELTGTKRTSVAYNLFVALNSKLLQIDANAGLPKLPPTQDFDGDTLSIQAELAPGELRLTPSAPNSQNATTEILIQPLPSLGRQAYWNKYRSLAFVHFTSTSTVSIPLPNGDTPSAYAIAYRFVNATTGQQTELTPLAILQRADQLPG